VEGVYTTDPRVVPNASRLEQISYEEMLELAHAGANVLHPRSVETAKLFNVPLRVRSSFKLDNLGTLILGVEEMEIYQPVAGVAADLSKTRIVVTDVQDKPGRAALLFGELAKEGISVDIIVQSYVKTVTSTNDIAFTVDDEDVEETLAVVERIKSELGGVTVQVHKDIAKVSIIGAGMIDRPGIASAMFKTLADNDINIWMISTSEIKISCIIKKEYAQKAVKALHKEFGLESDEVAQVKGDLPS
jgi:aspartate kinase